MKQQSKKKNHDVHAKFREFAVGDAVFERDFLTGKKRLTGTVSQISGSVSYHVTLVDWHVIRGHVIHVYTNIFHC